MKRYSPSADANRDRIVVSEEGELFTEEGASLEDYFCMYVNSTGSRSARGIELSLATGASEFLSSVANYTYAIAKGRNSSPTENYSYGWAGYQIPDDDTYYDWDQRHTVNISLDFRVPRGEGPRLADYSFLEGFGLNLIWQYGSGCPYDNPEHETHPFFRNQNRYPAETIADLKINKQIWINDLTFNLYCNILNIFNEKISVQSWMHPGMMLI